MRGHGHYNPPTLRLSALLRRLGISRRQRHPIRQLPIQTDLEGILARSGQGYIEHQDGTGLDIDHAGGRLAELNGPLSAQQLVAAFIHKPNANGVHPNLGTPTPNSEHQMSPGVHCREIREPDVLEHAQDTELALLVDQGVIGDDGEIEMQLR
jgi:hypothetical protein